MTLLVRHAGPAMTLQDLGRAGYMAQGLSSGGAADRFALIEGAVLLGHGPACAALEMAGMGGTFEATQDTAIALTGAPMPAKIGARPVHWNASHALAAGELLTIGGARSGVYGYLHVAGGFQADVILGSRSAHLASGLGALVQTGDGLPMYAQTARSQMLPAPDRFSGGTLRILPSAHTAAFSDDSRARLEATTFTRAARGNRQGVALDFDGPPFGLEGQLTVLSNPMLAGDIQMTGDGRPFVLLTECQTTGGYPRIGAVVPDDLPIMAQAQAGTKLRFAFVEHAQAVAAHRSVDQIYADLRRTLQPLVRDPRAVPDLLSYQLIGGAVTGRDDEED